MDNVLIGDAVWPCRLDRSNDVRCCTKLDDEPRRWSRMMTLRAQQGKTMQDKTRRGEAKKTKWGEARQGWAKQGKTRQRQPQEEEEIAGILFRWLLVGQFFPVLRNVNFAVNVLFVSEMETLYPFATSSVNRSKGMTVAHLPVSSAPCSKTILRGYVHLLTIVFVSSFHVIKSTRLYIC